MLETFVHCHKSMSIDSVTLHLTDDALLQGWGASGLKSLPSKNMPDCQQSEGRGEVVCITGGSAAVHRASDDKFTIKLKNPSNSNVFLWQGQGADCGAHVHACTWTLPTGCNRGEIAALSPNLSPTTVLSPMWKVRGC